MKKYNVMLWSGRGYILDVFNAEAENEYQALDIVVTELINKGLTAYYLTEEEYNELFKDEINNNPEFESDQYCYIDATIEGAEYPVYLLVENMRIELAA